MSVIVQGKYRVWLMGMFFSVLFSFSSYAALPTTIPGLLDAAARSAIDIFSSGYVIIALSIIILFILFKSIIQLALSNMPWQNVDQEVMKKLSTTLALIMTLGLIGYSGYSNGGYSVGNIENNVARVYGTLGGTAGPWILGILLGSLVYFNISKNNPDRPFISKLGAVFIAIGLTLWASQRIIGGLGIGTGLSLAVLGVLLFFVGKNGSGTGSDVFGALGNRLSNWITNGGKKKDKTEDSIEDKIQEEKTNEESVEKGEKEIDNTEDSVKIRIAEVMDYLRQEKNDLQQVYSDKEKLEQIIKSQIEPSFDKMLRNRQDPNTLREGFSVLNGVMDVIQREENVNTKIEKLDKKKDRRIYKDMFVKVQRMLQKDIAKVTKQITILRKEIAKGNAASEQVYQRYERMRDALQKELFLFTGQNTSGVNLHSFVLDMEQLHKNIAQHDSDIKQEFHTVENTLKSLEQHATNFQNETDEEKKELLKEIFYKEFNKGWGKVQQYFQKMSNNGLRIIQDVNRLIKNIEYFSQLLAQLAQLTNFVAQEHKSIESLMGDVHRFSEDHVQAYQQNLDALGSFHSMTDQVQTKFGVITKHFFVDLSTFDTASGELISLSHNAEQKGQELIQQFSQQGDHMKAELSSVKDRLQQLKIFDQKATIIKQIHDQFRGEKVRDVSLLERNKMINVLNTWRDSIRNIPEKTGEPQPSARAKAMQQFDTTLDQLHQYLDKMEQEGSYYQLDEQFKLSELIDEYKQKLPDKLTPQVLK